MTIAERLAAGDLAGAAALALQEGDAGRAAELYEQACEFELAAKAALAAADAPRALRLAILAGAPGLGERAERLILERPPGEVAGIAADLCHRGHHEQGARLYRGANMQLEAAEAFVRADRAIAAARCFDAANKPAQAARTLEAALRSEPDADVDALRVELGTLYGRHAKHQAAVRVLQQLEPSSHHRRRALPWLAQSLEALGLRQARRDLEPELAGLGPVESLAEPSRPSAPDANLYGRYRVVREVATTPHARLLEAVDEVNDTRVAVKILATRAGGTGRDALARFVREAKALAQLRHPNVVPLEAYVAEGPAMVLSWMAGGSLRDLIDREPISPARAVEIARGVLDALAEAHRLGILHRDVKPSNLLFDEGGTCRLADFGAAHMASSDATVTVGAIGTMAYMAPEQRAGRAATVQSDIYAVGVMLHEMLTGELPNIDDYQPLARAHPDLEAAHDDVLRRFLVQEPDGRHQDAVTARQALEQLAWPARIVARARPSAPRAAKVEGGRLGPPEGHGDHHDRWLGRDVTLAPIAALDRLAPFARADHPALPSVLRIDREAGRIWLDAPRGKPLGDRPLTDSARQVLAEALATLHRCGGHHGAVRRDQIWLVAGFPRLALPRDLPTGDAAGDLAALAAI